MKKKIFLVEDDLTILSQTKLILEMNNFEVLTSVNGVDALDHLIKSSTLPDLILSDIRMPKMGGYDFYKKTRNIEKLRIIPFIFFSAKASPEDVRFGKSLGADDYLTKPFDGDKLLKMIELKLKNSKIK